ncbi:MAG: hypothetical protein ACLVAA_00060 [Ruthenibacterium sp.]|nr:hypothetical protein [Oscillospiraceae bacterium]
MLSLFRLKYNYIHAVAVTDMQRKLRQRLAVRSTQKQIPVWEWCLDQFIGCPLSRILLLAMA